MVVDVSPEGIEYLNGVKTTLVQSMEEIVATTQKLRGEVDSHNGIIGPHQDKIEEIFEIIGQSTDDAVNGVTELLPKIDQLIIKYQEIIDSDYISLKSSTVKRIKKSTASTVSSQGGTQSGTVYSVTLASSEESFATDLNGIKETLSLSEGDSNVIQSVGTYKQLPSSKQYERHHIPSKAVLQEFGVNTDNWPCICLEKEDHAKTDSYRGKQRHKSDMIFTGEKGPTYKDSTIEMLDTPGGFSALVRDEIYNIRAACGEKYDKAIGDFIDLIVDHVRKNGIPKR